MMPMQIHCDWCGKDLGPSDGFDYGPESCGAPECDREIRYAIQAQEAEARERAEEDGFSLYGGPGR